MNDIEHILGQDPSLSDVVDRIARPHAAMTPAGVPASATQSYVGGHPFLPVGTAWPTSDDGDPLVFVAQINFAEVALDGFPRAGMLQWFIDSNHSTLGLFDDEGRSDGKHGLNLRWFDASELSQAPAAEPTESLPYDADWTGFAGPLLTTAPVAIAFTPGVDMPSLNEVADTEFPEDGRFNELSEAYFELCEETDGFLPAMGDKVGGYPRWEQGAEFPSADHPDLRVLIQLDAETEAFVLWGDLGVGQLLGNPGQVAAGDLSSVVWDWACG